MGKALENFMWNLFPVSKLNYFSPFSGKLEKRQRVNFKLLIAYCWVVAEGAQAEYTEFTLFNDWLTTDNFYNYLSTNTRTSSIHKVQVQTQ